MYKVSLKFVDKILAFNHVKEAKTREIMAVIEPSFSMLFCKLYYQAIVFESVDKS